MPDDRPWIEDVEIEDVKIKWAFSNFDGREHQYNAQGDHNFVMLLDKDFAEDLAEKGWNVKEKPGYEEGDPPEYHLEVKISYKYGPPKIFLIKGNRKFRADERDLADIRRDTCEQIDVVITPSRWVYGGNSGITAYAKELYAKVKESRFADKYADYEDI